jgi:hypothetical protein
MSEDKNIHTPPNPPDPQQRDKPLPWQHIKSVTEDPQAPARVQAILDHPSYRQPDHDLDFLGMDATRTVRLQIDYLKPELILTQQNQTYDYGIWQHRLRNHCRTAGS